MKKCFDSYSVRVLHTYSYKWTILRFQASCFQDPQKAFKVNDLILTSLVSCTGCSKRKMNQPSNLSESITVGACWIFIGEIWWRSQCRQHHCCHKFLYRFFSVFFLTKNEDEDYPYSRSESIGMACLNKFAIDEENQNEIRGVYFIKPWLQNSAFDKEVIQGALQQCPRAGISELIRPTVLLSVDPRQKA